jgi:hypothetical protein
MNGSRQRHAIAIGKDPDYDPNTPRPKMRVDVRPRVRELRAEARAERERLRRPACPIPSGDVGRRVEALISELFAAWQEPDVVQVAARFLLDLAGKGAPTRDGRSAIERSHRYYGFAASERVCESAVDAVIRHLSVDRLTIKTARGLGVKLREVEHEKQYGTIRVVSDRQRRVAASVVARIVHRVGNIVDRPGRSFDREVEVEAKPKGRALFARCVAHDDRNPSMQINRDGGCWCFACSAIVGRVVQRDGNTVRIAVYGAAPVHAEPLPGEVSDPATSTTTPTPTRKSRPVRGRGGRFARALAAVLDENERADRTADATDAAAPESGPSEPPVGFLIRPVRSAGDADKYDPPCTALDPALVCAAGEPVRPSPDILNLLRDNGATAFSGWEDIDPATVRAYGMAMPKRGAKAGEPPQVFTRTWCFGFRPAYHVLSQPSARTRGDLPNEYAGCVKREREVDSDRSLFDYMLSRDERRTGPAAMAELLAYSESGESKKPGGLWDEFVSIDRLQATVSRPLKTLPLAEGRVGERTRYRPVRWKSTIATHLLVDLDGMEGPISPVPFQRVAHKLEAYAKSRPWLSGHYLAVRTSDSGIQVLFTLRHARLDPEAFRRDPQVIAAQREAEAFCLAVAREAGFTGGYADRSAGAHNRRARLPGPRVDKHGRPAMAYVIATSVHGWRGKADPMDAWEKEVRRDARKSRAAAKAE